ncbi:hypothetical protein [Bacillus thuringiensis]|uniref:Uncharacterized protein n=2 Tax=Bacillus thuringiensis TaxID=1428 RepID=A0A9W3TH90_BACTU|nr:hypothetical protein [Bacillus thuringiensis]AQY41511.1 hypothetical protein B4918_27780 [Bacillus thuringiensis]MDR4150059.1 hypothetical protein [Bacillus thuringiensis]MED2022612.1 hypothetical protein [Bacillus thuringiensis]
MGTENRVLPEHLMMASELEKERKECIQNRQLLYKQMEQANRNGDKIAYVELHDLYQKQNSRDLEISKELSAMYFKKIKNNSSKERKKVLQVADRLEEVGGRKEVVDSIRRNS